MRRESAEKNPYLFTTPLKFIPVVTIVWLFILISHRRVDGGPYRVLENPLWGESRFAKHAPRQKPKSAEKGGCADLISVQLHVWLCRCFIFITCTRFFSRKRDQVLRYNVLMWLDSSDREAASSAIH